MIQRFNYRGLHGPRILGQMLNLISLGSMTIVERDDRRVCLCIYSESECV